MPLFTNEDVVSAVDLDIRNLASGTDSVTAIGPLTDTELRATPVPVTIPTPVPVTDNGGSLTIDGSVSVTGSVAVTGPLTDTQLRATAVPVSGPLTDTQLRATPVPVTSSPVTSSSATISQVNLTGNTNATLLSANANRKKVVLFAPKNTLYIKFGATASATSFTYIAVAANTLFEITTWIGQIDVLSTVNQTVTVTEMV